MHCWTRRSIALAAAALASWATLTSAGHAGLRPARSTTTTAATHLAATAGAASSGSAPTTAAVRDDASAAPSARAGAATASLLPLPSTGLLPDAPSGGPAGAASDASDGALLRVRVDTNSDWTGIHFDGAVGGIRVVSSAPTVPVTPEADGLTIPWVPTGGATVVVDLVLEHAAGRTASTVTVLKGWLGLTRVAIENRSGTPTAVATITNERQVLDDRNNTLTTSVPADVMFVNVTPLRRTGERPKVLAFYYPWFDTYDSGRLADRPSDPRNVEVIADVASMLAQARAHGIDGFIESWAGADHDGQELDVLLAAAHQTGASVSLYLETVSANIGRTSLLPSDRATVSRWLREGLDRAASDPAFVRDASGVPVVFVYEMDRLSPADWASVLAEAGRPVRLVGDEPSRDYESVEWGVHRYDPNADGSQAISSDDLTAWNRTTAFETRAAAITAPGGAARLFAATVSPGFDNRNNGGSLYVDRGDAGQHYLSTWDAALAAAPEWVLVTTWNEWYEGTSVEPSQRFGDLALRQTATRAAAWKSGG